MAFLPPAVLGLFSVLGLLLAFKASTESPLKLSAQGCRMSWMSPSYVLQQEFNASWTPLAQRYSLWLYREVGWERELHGSPVLFIPGNAGSSHQVRSIASSSTRQFFSSPDVPALSAPLKPADYFALEFNEDLSALHGPTLTSQRAYAAVAIRYILSLYPPGTSVTVMGHSMGGVVATALLPSPDIAAVITMSTPHALPPARFDARIEDLYAHTRHILTQDPTPVLSLCGGATDAMIPSEACILPELALTGNASRADEPYRRTVFASALEGAWTGVGHREMVWCHQVRWRVARAALELSAASTSGERSSVLDRWLTDGSRAPAEELYPHQAELLLKDEQTQTLQLDTVLTIRDPSASKTYLLPIPAERRKFTLFLSGGSIPPVAPQHALSLRASIYVCPSSEACKPLRPTTHKLIPNPVPGRMFPVPDEGSDESEGVVLFEVDDVFLPAGAANAYVAIKVENAENKGWLLAGFSEREGRTNDASTLAAMLGKLTIPINPSSLSTTVHLPNLINNVLVAYRVTPRTSQSSCAGMPSRFLSHGSTPGALLPPLLTHTSPYETHYHPLHSPRPILLHAHASAPYLPVRSRLRGITLTVHSSGEHACAADSMDIAVDRWATLGRLGARLWPALATSAVGVAALVLFGAWSTIEHGGPPPSVSASLTHFIRHTLPGVLLGALALAPLPLPADYALGTAGEPLFAPLAPVLVALAAGLVCVSWGALRALLSLVGAAETVARRLLGRPNASAHAGPRAPRTAALSLALIFALVLLLVPWQVAFLGAWAVHLHTCASARAAARGREAPALVLPHSEAVEAIPFEPLSVFEDPRVGPRPQRRLRTPGHPGAGGSASAAAKAAAAAATARARANEHVLLLLTWLLPFAAPVLAVWVRTLLTAGWTAPFDGDHNVLYVAPFLVLVDYASWARQPILERHPRERISARWTMVLVAAVAFVMGARHTYRIFDVVSFSATILVVCRVVPRYL